MASLQPSPRSRLRVQSRVNDNQCIEFVIGQKDSVCVSGQIGLNPPPVIARDKKLTVNCHVDFCVANAHFVTGLPQKKGVNPNCCQMNTEIKYVKDVSCVGHLSSANLVTNVSPVVIDPPVGARLHNFWEKWEVLGSSPKVVTTLNEGYNLPFPVQTELNHVTNCHKQLSKPIQTGPPFRGTVSVGEQKCSRTGSKPELTRVLQPAIFGTQTQQPVETSLGPEHLPKHRVVQNGDPRDNKDLPTVGGMGHIHRFQRRILPYTNSQSVQEVHALSHPGPVLQFKALPFGLSTAPMEFTVVATEVKLMALQRGIRILQYLDDWLVRATSHQPCLQHTQILVALCRELGWLVNKEKSELDPKQVFNFVGSLTSGRARSDQHQIVGRPYKTRYCQFCPVRQFMSLIGLLTATEKQVHLGRLHMRPIQWHLKNNWRVPESLDTRSQITPPSPKVVAGGKQCASRSTITPTKTCSADIYRCIKRRAGRSLKQAHCKGNLVPSRKQVAYKPLGTKGCLSGPKRVPVPLFKQHGPGSHRQHNSGCLYQQRRGDEVGLSAPYCGESCPGAPGNSK